MIDPNLLLIACFAGVFTLVVGGYWIFIVIPEQRGQGIVRRRLKWEAAPRSDAGGPMQLLKKQQVLSTIDSLNALLKRSENVSGPVRQLVDQADVGLTVGSFLLLSLVAFLGALVVVQWYLGVWWLSFVAGGVAGAVPFAVLSQMR